MVKAHMVCSLLSYAAFLVAFLCGALFLIQERQVKRRTLGRLFHNLPSLETLDRANFAAIGIGFGLLTIGLLCGLLGTRAWLGRWWTGDPKEYLTVLLWIVYLALWWMRLRSTLRGRRVALLSTLGFGLMLYTFLGAGEFAPSWHPSLASRAMSGRAPYISLREMYQ